MNILKRFWKSLYSPPDVAQFRDDKISKSIAYLFFLAFFAFLPLASYTAFNAYDMLQMSERTIQKDIPDFKIVNGKLETKEKEKGKLPLSIDKSRLHIYFDASGTLDPDNVDNKVTRSESALAFLADKVYFTTGGTGQSVNYDMIGIYNKADLMKLYRSVEQMSKYLIPVIWLIIFIFALGFLFFQVALYALCGFLLLGLGKSGISYRQNWLMATYSITLATTFTTVMEWLHVTVPFHSEINMAVNLIFIFLVVRTISSTKINR